MAQTINTTINSGLFNASAAELQAITENSFTADLSDCKDAVTVIADAASASGEFSFVCISDDGKSRTEIPLIAGALNVFHITTKGLKKKDGSADFEIAGDTSAASAGIKVAFLKYISVINN